MIKIQIKTAKKFSGYCKYSAFTKLPIKYYSLLVKEKLAYYDDINEEWEVSQLIYQKLLNLLSNEQISISNEYLLFEYDFEKELKTKPFPHQLEGIQYGLTHQKFHLGDEQGLGKTMQTINIAVLKKLRNAYKHCLIICGVATLRWNWRDEILTHSNEQCCLLGFRTITKGVNKGQLKDKGSLAKLEDLQSIPEEYFWIINIEALRDEKILKELQKLCKKGEINMIVAEEVHKMKNPTCHQSKAFLKLDAETKITVSGTPLINSPVDLYAIFKWLGVEQHTYTAFKNHYCVFGGFAGREIIGYQRLNELKSLLNKIQLRRLKQDVLTLPQKFPQTIYVEMGKEQQTVYNEILIQLQQQIDLILLNPNPLSQLTRLRQATGCPELLSSTVKQSVKLDKLEELVEELAKKGEQCLIFSNWVEMCEKAKERLIKKFKVLTYTSNNKNLKQTEMDFKENKDIVALIGTIKLMGTGLTFTNCTTVIFLDSPWTMADKNQCIDRTHRIGQTQNVNIYTIVCANTVDEKVEKIIQKKAFLSNNVVDNRKVLNSKQTLDFLLF